MYTEEFQRALKRNTHAYIILMASHTASSTFHPHI